MTFSLGQVLYLFWRRENKTFSYMYTNNSSFPLLSVSLQVHTESQMASGDVQNELMLKAWCCESLAFSKRSVAWRRPPRESACIQETAFIGAHTDPNYSFPLYGNKQLFGTFKVHTCGWFCAFTQQTKLCSGERTSSTDWSRKAW